MQDGLQESRDRFRNNMSSRAGSNSPTPGGDARVIARSRQHARRSVIFTPALQVHRYPPAVWGEEEEVDDDDEWDVGGYEDEDPSLAEDAALAEQERRGGGGGDSDDGMSWEEALPDRSHLPGTAEEQRRQQELHAQQLQQQKQQQLQQQQEAEQQAAQQQRQQIEEQRRQQLITQMMAHQAAAAPSTQGTIGLSIRTPDSREQLAPPQDTSASASTSPSSSNSPRSIDPAEASETKKISLTPLVVQDKAQARSAGPMLPSELMQQQEEDRKRTREEIGALEDARKKVKSPSNSRTSGGPAKLRKEPQSDDDSGKEKDKKGKSGGLFGRLFDRRKDKHKEKGTNDSVDITGSRSTDTRGSEESGRSSNHTDNSGSVQTPPRRTTAQVNTPPPVSQHATSLRQRDREQQALYQQQYLTRSPASPPEAQSLIQVSPASPRQGVIPLGGASATLSPTSDGRRPRPGSLLIGGNLSGDGSSSVPELSVIRVFAGKRLQSEATFKTVLLNSSTTSEELVKQAMQRFRLPAGDDTADYFLTVKRLGGSSAALRPEEKPLVVFETLAEAALDLPKVKRSSVGSISSIASNLSQHPAIKQLPMNDFTDDTAVKIYLNRHSESGSDESATAEESDTLTNSESAQADGENSGVRLRPHNLTISGATVASERFSSPTFRFALQLLIYPDDLPDDMVFDPLTEAIVFKHTLRDRSQVTASSAPFRRKIFMFPKNITVAEVIEIGLERFGIPDAVVDGGDEVEDKNTKRRSSSRVRYVLNVLVDGKGWLCLFFRSHSHSFQ
jgi:Ras association (RalGDS/AF-6) domain